MPNILVCDLLQGTPNSQEQAFRIPGLELAKVGLCLAPHLLDGIQVMTVRRQRPDLGTGSLDGRASRGIAMNGQVIHDDDVRRLQRGGKYVFRPDRKGCSIHRAFKDPRSLGTIAANGGDHGRRFPATVRDVVVYAGTARTASVQSGHVRSCAGFIKKQKATMRHPGYRLTPTCPCFPDVGTVQFGGTERLFFNGRSILKSM